MFNTCSESLVDLLREMDAVEREIERDLVSLTIQIGRGSDLLGSIGAQAHACMAARMHVGEEDANGGHRGHL